MGAALGSTTSVTSIVNACSADRAGLPSSVTRTRTVYDESVSKSKLAAVRSVSPTIAKEALSSDPAPATRA